MADAPVREAPVTIDVALASRAGCILSLWYRNRNPPRDLRLGDVVNIDLSLGGDQNE